MEARSLLSPDLLRVYEEGRRLVEAGQLEEGLNVWRTVATRAADRGDPTTAAWMLGRVGQAWAKALRWGEVDRAYEEALGFAEHASAREAPARLLREWGELEIEHNDWEAGEGLLGLTRAFQYAGARSVLASLWSVGDASTADLMKRFYGHLRKGASKDEALRAAQVEMLQGPYAHPFHWAAFQLSGDWR